VRQNPYHRPRGGGCGHTVLVDRDNGSGGHGGKTEAVGHEEDGHRGSSRHVMPYSGPRHHAYARKVCPVACLTWYDTALSLPVLLLFAVFYAI
jgi:hypothetical protein